jgi:Integrase zinc binding domain
MGISLAVEVKTDDEQPIVDNTMDISIGGPVHSGDGVNEEQSRLIRAAYEQLKSTIISDFSEDATAQVCSTTLTTNTISNLQNKDMEIMIWHAYEHASTVAQENDTEAVTTPIVTPRVYVIQPANLTDNATATITNLDSISVKEWSDAQRSDTAWAPWFDYFEQQRLPIDKTMRAAMIREAAHFTLTQCSDGTSVLQHRSQHIINGESLRLVVPSGMRRRVLQHSHSTKWNGHVGPSKTAYIIRLSFWWPTLLVDCTSYCRSCIDCQQRKRPWSKQQPVLHWPVNRPFQRLAMDLLDLKTISTNGHVCHGSY